MPVKRKQDTKGPYYQWGNHGKKYRYKPNNPISRQKAKEKAKRQGMAVHSSGWRGY